MTQVASVFAPADDKAPEHWPETGWSGDTPSKGEKSECENLLIYEETVTDAIRNLAVFFIYVDLLLVFVVNTTEL
jgi:hypothetical protein